MPTKPTGDTSLFATNRNLEISNLFALLGGGILIKIIFNAQGPANSTIWGYGLSSVAIFLLLIISISFSPGISKLPDEKNIENYLNIFVKYALPPTLLLIIILWVIGQTISNFKKINSNILPREFNLYSFISSFLIIVQSISLYKYFNEEFNLEYRSNKKSSAEMQDKIAILDNSAILYILTILNVIILGMMQIVLEFFTTDG